MLIQALYVEIEMKNLNLRVALLVQKDGNAVPTPPHPCLSQKQVVYEQKYTKMS